MYNAWKILNPKVSEENATSHQKKFYKSLCKVWRNGNNDRKSKKNPYRV